MIKASVTASFVNVPTSEPELAMDFLTLRLRETDPQTMVYLYPNAQPVENENQKVLMESLSEVIAGIQSSLAADNLSEDERRSLTERLEEKRRSTTRLPTWPSAMRFLPRKSPSTRPTGRSCILNRPAYLTPARKMDKMSVNWKNVLPMAAWMRILSSGRWTVWPGCWRTKERNRA